MDANQIVMYQQESSEGRIGCPTKLSGSMVSFDSQSASRIEDQSKLDTVNDCLGPFDGILNQNPSSPPVRSRATTFSAARKWSSSQMLPVRTFDYAPIGHVLIVDDDVGACMVLQRMLSSLSFNCDFAIDGAEAVRAARRQNYDLIITDMLMPDKSGWDVATEILTQPHDPSFPDFQLTGYDSPLAQGRQERPRARACGATGPPVVVGVLSQDEEGMRLRCADAGMSDVLVKPIDRTVILSTG